MQYVVKQDVFFHHFLVSVRGHSNFLSLRLKSKPRSDGMDVMRIYLIHYGGTLLCISRVFKIFFHSPMPARIPPQQQLLFIFSVWLWRPLLVAVLPGI